MTSVRSAFRVAGMLASVLVLANTESPAAQGLRVRTLPHQNLPIESRLLPDDQIIEMNYWADVAHPDYGNETAEQTIARMVRQTDVIVAVRITKVEPFLVENDSWIRTRVTGRADNVIKGGPGEKFEALYDGGEMVIKGVRIKADSYPILRPGSRYLIFVMGGGGTPWILDAFSLDDGKTVGRPEWAQAKALPKSPFAGRSAQQAIADVKKATVRR